MIPLEEFIGCKPSLKNRLAALPFKLKLAIQVFLYKRNNND